MNIIQRAKAPTPKFFKVLRNIGLALAAVGGAVLAAPIALPLVVSSIGGYLAVAGGIISAVSQMTVSPEPPESPVPPNPLKGEQNVGGSFDSAQDKENLNKARDGD